MITVLERANSRPLINDPKSMRATREYWAQGDLDEDVLEVNGAISAAAPLTYLGLVRRRIELEPQGGGFWYGRVEYGRQESEIIQSPVPGLEGFQPLAGIGPDDKLGTDFSFNTAGGTEHITRSYGTVEEAAYNGRAIPETNNAIGVSQHGVAGCDIVQPKFELSITKRVSHVTMRYVNQLVACTGKYNDRQWNSIEEKAALFLGADGQSSGQVDDFFWTINYKFLLGEHQEDIVIRPHHSPALQHLSLRIARKFAHDYLWVGYELDEVATAGTILQVPWFAKVERVYRGANFADLLGF